MKMRKFITDTGNCTAMTIEKTGETLLIPRYVLWMTTEEGNPQFIEASEFLVPLLAKYNLSRIEVYDTELKSYN